MTCDGKGQIPCAACGSRGLVKCLTCKGSGSLRSRNVALVRWYVSYFLICKLLFDTYIYIDAQIMSLKKCFDISSNFLATYLR